MIKLLPNIDEESIKDIPITQYNRKIFEIQKMLEDREVRNIEVDIDKETIAIFLSDGTCLFGQATEMIAWEYGGMSL